REPCFDGAKRKVRKMLVRRRAPLEPRVVRNVDQYGRPLAGVRTCELGEDRFVANDDPGFSERDHKGGLGVAATKPSEVVHATEPLGVHERNAFNDWNKKLLTVRRLYSHIAVRISDNGGIEIGWRCSSD